MEAIQRRWSRGQETDFVKTVINFGVDFSLKEGTFVWERFRQLSKVKLVADGGNEAIINPAENSQRLAISNKLGLVFAGKSGVHFYIWLFIKPGFLWTFFWLWRLED